MSVISLCQGIEPFQWPGTLSQSLDLLDQLPGKQGAGSTILLVLYDLLLLFELGRLVPLISQIKLIYGANLEGRFSFIQLLSGLIDRTNPSAIYGNPELL